MPSLTSCKNHPQYPAVGTCPQCGNPYCERCMTFRGSKYVCKACHALTTGGERTMVMTSAAARRRGPAADGGRQGGRHGGDAGGDGETLEGVASSGGVSEYSVLNRHSRYNSVLILRKWIKRLVVFTVLAIGIVFAWLPVFSKFALDEAYSDDMIPRVEATRTAVIVVRIHLFYGRPEEAISIIDAAIKELTDQETSPDRPLLYFYKGVAYMKMREEEAVQEVLGEFRRKWPDHERVVEASEMIQEAERMEAMRHLNRQDAYAHEVKVRSRD